VTALGHECRHVAPLVFLADRMFSVSALGPRPGAEQGAGASALPATSGLSIQIKSARSLLFVRRLRPAERTCSQIGRQSVRHSPWHLNSLPIFPILPPHSGHTQFRMPDITSAFVLAAPHLVNCIRPPYDNTLDVRPSTFTRGNPLNKGALCIANVADSELLNALPVPNKREECDVRCNSIVDCVDATEL
jgi:hypothetical protein